MTAVQVVKVNQLSDWQKRFREHAEQQRKALHPTDVSQA